MTLTPAGLGTQTGTLTIAATPSSDSQTVSLTGKGVTATTISPTTAAFGNVVAGTTSATKDVILTNNQLVALNTISFSVPAGSGYTVVVPTSGAVCLSTLAAGKTCAVGLTLSPAVLGAVPAAELTVKSDAGGTQTVSLTGAGVTATTVSPATVGFGNLAVGTTSATRNVTLRNNQQVTLNNILFTAPTGSSYIYAVVAPTSGTQCGSTLAAGKTCAEGLTLMTTVGGAVPAAALTVKSDAGGTQTVPLTGAGTPSTIGKTTLSPATANFGNVAVNTASKTIDVTLKNNQMVTLNGISFAVASGSGYAVVAPTSGTQCGTTLAAGMTCAEGLTLTPTALGAVPAVALTVKSDAGGTQTVTLTGAGVTPTTISPAILGFGNVTMGTASATKNVTLTNNQVVQLKNISFSVPAGSGYTLVAPTSGTACGTTLNAGSTCAVGLTLNPAALGAVPAADLSVVSDAGGTQTVTLTGNGTTATTISPTTLAFGNVTQGTTSAVKDVTLTNNQTLATLTGISFSVPAGSGYAKVAPSSGTACGTTLGAGLSCTVGLTLKPTAQGAVPAAVLTVASSPGGTQTVALSGSGVSATAVSPATLAFGKVPVGTVSATKDVTLKNYQAVTLGSISFSVPAGSGYALTTPLSGTACGSTVAAGASCTMGVTLTPAALNAVPAVLTIMANAGGTQTVSLTGTGANPTAVSPSTLAFGNITVGTTSATKDVTLTNYQTVPLTSISFAAPSGSGYVYTVVPPTSGMQCGSTLAANSSCTIGVSLTPTAPGTVSAASPASLTIMSSAGGTQMVTLTGTGITPVTLSPPALNLGNVAENQTGLVQYVTLTNDQASAVLTIKSIALSAAGGFALAPSALLTPPQCTYSGMSSLAASSSCVIGVALTPSVLGAVSPGTLTVVTVPGGTLKASLTGTGVVPVTVSPSPLNFTQAQGTSSTAELVTVTNVQAATLHFSGVTISGANSSEFSLTNNPCTTLSGGANCQLSIVFTPAGAGLRTATLNIADDASNSPQTVPLIGTATGLVTVSPTEITTFSAPVGNVTSTYVPITITNGDPTNPLNISRFQFTGDFRQTTGVGGTNLCAPPPTTVAAGASCILTVGFAPTIGGYRTGQLAIYDSAPTSPQVVNLAGNGTSPLTLSSSYINFSAQKIGTDSAPTVLTLTNHEVQQETFTLAPTANFTVTTNCSTGIIPANSSCMLSVVFAPATGLASGPISGSLSIANSAPGGGTLGVSLSGSATTSNPAAAVASVSPGAAAAGTTVNVVITGNGYTNFSSSSAVSFVDVNSASFASDITVNNCTAATLNQLNCSLTLGANPADYGARSITVTTPLSGGGTETAFLNSAFIVADPTNAHTIDSVTPPMGTQGQTLNVALTATGTHFDSTTFANFGDGVTVNFLTVTDATDATANITISNTTTVGYRTVTLVTGGEFATSSAQAFQIGPNNASLVSVTPNSSGQSASLPVVIVGANTHWLQNATTFSFTGGIQVGDVQVNTPTSATVQLSVPANATPGLQNVTVTTGGEIATLNNAFTVISTTPYLSSVSPVSAKQGQQNVNVEIKGVHTNFSSVSPASVIADFTGEITINSIAVNSATDVVVNISVSQVANVGSITARLTSIDSSGNATIFPFTFTVTASAASIVSVVPASVPQGGQVTLAVTGLNTIWDQNTTQAAFYPEPYGNPIVNQINVADATDATLNITVATTVPPGTYPFYLATGGQVVSSSITVYANTPSMTMSPANGLVPSSGTNSFNVSFTGQFTHWTHAGTLPVISGEGITLTNFTVNSPVSATGTINIAAGAATTLIDSQTGIGNATCGWTRLVTFTTGSEIDRTCFNATTTPVGIVSISPYHAPQNDTLNVAIVGLNTHFAAGQTTVQFGPQITVNSVSVTDATDLVVNITTSYLYNGASTATPPGFQSVYVNTGAEQVIGGFSVDPPASPTLVSVTPSSAAQGSTVDVTITGSLTNWVQGTTEAILGAGVTVSNLTITSPTTATATIAVSPTAPVGGNSVIMITGPEVVSGTGFSVTPSAAYITSVLPAVQCNANDATYLANICNGSAPVVSQLQTVTMNVVGVGTHWQQGETTLNFGPGVVVDQLNVKNPTTATVEITVLSNSPVGFAALTANTDGEVATLQQAIDIEEGFPTLLAISPGGAEQGANLTLQVLGRFTHFQQGVTSLAFSPAGVTGITVNSIRVIDDDTLTANVTVEPWAYIDLAFPCGHVLTVTTGDEQISTAPILDNFCVSQGAAQIDSVSASFVATDEGSSGPVTITGSETHFIQGVTQLSFGDPNFQVGQITVNSPTSLTASVAVNTNATAGYKTVTVSTYGETATQQYGFTVNAGEPALTEANPYQAEQGAQNLDVILTGQFTHFDGDTTATFGAGIVVNSVTLDTATQITANITIDPLSYVGGRTVTVTTPNLPCAGQPASYNYTGCAPGQTTGTGSEIVTDNAFTIIPGPAIISQAAPNTGNEGQEVVFTITGANTHWQQNFTQFYIAGGGSDITINSVVINSATSATVDMSISPTANPGPRSIYMITAGESLTDAGAFVVTGGIPVITYLSPNSAVQGANQLEVVIHGLYTNWASGSSTVNFGPGVTVTSFQVDDATHIEAVINVDAAATPGYRTVVVATGTQGLTSNFLVTTPPPPPTPYVWNESPSSGIPGQTLTVNFYGANTEWNPGTTTLTGWDSDNIVVNTFQVTGPTSARANITIGANAQGETMGLTFTTTGTADYGTEVDNARFTIVIAQPVLSIVDPGSGMQGAGLNGTQPIVVNIIGQFTAFDSTTTFSFGSGITVNGPPTILGPTIATQSITIGQTTPTGGYAVVATTPDAPANAKTVGGAYFSVTPSLAQISAVTPNTAKQGDAPTVEVTGQNTHWDGSTVFQFGSGITVTSTMVNSETDATLVLSIPALAPEGATSVRATTLGEIASLNNAFVVQAGTPYLLSSGPSSLPQQDSATFTILSQQTSWTAANPPTVSYGAGIVVTNVTVTGPTSMTVTGYVQPTTTVGYRSLTVTSGSQVLGLSNVFYVTPGPAVINSITPSSGGQGVNLPAVQINGTNTNWQQGITTLTFPGVLVNSFIVNSPTSITANITVNTSASPGQVTVTTVTGGEVATKVNAFTVVQTQPELLSVVSSSGQQGQNENVTLTGLYTHFSSSSVIGFGAGVTVNTFTATTSTSISANITVSPTAATGHRNVSVVTGGESVAITNGYNVTAGPAAILSLSPSSGSQDTTATILVTGSQTHFATGQTSAVFYGGIMVTSVSVVDALHANVDISIPSGTAVGSYNVSLVTGGEVATILGGFSVTSGGAQLTAVNPPTGAQGATNLNVTLTGLYTGFVNGTSVANFGAGITVNSTTVSSATSATANITISDGAALGSRNVSVTTGGQVASITGGFSVTTGVAALSSAMPATGSAGATLNVVVNGNFTSFQQGVTTVTFGDGIATNVVTVSSATQLTANITIPSNASVGNTYISVSTNSQNVQLNNAFAVTAGTPVITVINPNIGNPGQSLSVTITGRYTNWVNGTTTASFGPGISVGGAANGVSGPVTVNNATSLTANLIISAGAALGPVSVVTTTGGEVENVPGGFTIQSATPPSPTVISLSPGPYVSLPAGTTNYGMTLNSIVTAVFSEPMNRTTITTSTVLLYLTSNQGQGNIQVTGTVTVDPTGRVVTFTPGSLLAPNSTYYFEMTNGIQSATNVALSTYTQDLYTNAVAATAAPTILAANPPASSTVGTNVTVQLEFSGDMNQNTASGLTVSTGGNPVAGTYSWNSYPDCGSCGYGPGTILSFTPSAPFAAGTTYTVAYSSALTDTAGNAIVPGSFTFTTGSGPDTTTNTASSNFNGTTNVGTNFVPLITYSKPVNRIDINTSTVQLYNYDSGKYIAGALTVAPNGLSATFTPSIPLLPDTYYRLYQAGGSYDVDGNNLGGNDFYFTTGDGSDLTAPTVSLVSPANSATSVPLNSQVLVRFSSAINPSNVNVITVTPSGGSAIAGTVSLASDLVTLSFVPATSLEPGKVYTVQVSGYTDLIGNVGTTFNSSFTTATSAEDINVSTGFTAGGSLITANGTADGHWTVVPTTGVPTPADTVFSASGTAQPLYVVGTGDTGFYSGWPVNGPNSDWIAINPESTTGNTFGVYSTKFTITGSVPSNLCLVGAMGVDDNGELGINGVSIMSNLSATGSLSPINIPISSFLVVGANTLSLAWGATDNSYEGFRLQAVIQTCGDSETGGLTLTSATPSNNSTGVSTNTTITMNFNNPIDPATVNTTTLPVMVGYNSNQELSGTYAVSGNQVVFTPDSPFPTSTIIYVGACAGPLDLAGDSAGGCYTQLMHFTTGTTATPASAPLQVMAFSLAANATNVGLRSPVTATFNRSVDLGTINSKDLGLFEGDGQSPWCTNYSHSQDDATVSFTCYALPASSTMTAILNSGITDWQGNPLQNFSSQFTTSQADANTNGSIVSYRPGNGASGVNANLPIVLFSNLPIDSASAQNGIQVAQNNVLIPGTVEVLGNGYTLQFTPSSPFVAGALIQWWTTNSLYETTYNTPISAVSGYFYVAGSTAALVPTIQATSSPNGLNPAPLNTIFDTQFNTPLNASTVNSTNIYLYDSTAGLHLDATITQPQPNEVLMVPTSPLPANDIIYVEVTTGLQSTTSVPATATSRYVYTGTTSDTTLPTVVSAVPYNGATNVGVNAAPGVVFNKPIDTVSLNSNTFQVLNGATPLAGSYTFSSNDTRVDFVPNAALPASTNLTMNINGVLDRVGNPVTYSSSFTTAAGPDFTAPTVVWSSVSSDESVPTNTMFTIQMSESMDVTTFTNGQPGACGNFYIQDQVTDSCIATTLTWNSSQNTFYLTPTAPLAAGREYRIDANGGTDLAGNTMNGLNIYFYAELSSASTAPTVVAFNPINGETVATNTLIKAQFSAPIDPNTVSGVTLKASGNPVTATPVLSVGNTVLQLVPQAPLSPNTTYTMTIAGVKDPAGNAVSTVTNSFTTGGTYDTTASAVVSLDPPNNSTVGTNVIAKILFNKPLDPTTANNTTFEMILNDTGQYIPLAVTLSSNGLEVTLTPQIPLLANTEYRFYAGTPSALYDEDGNQVSDGWYYFTTSGGADSTSPTVTVTPAPGATGIPLNAQATATLSVPMDPTSWSQSSIQLLNGATPVAGTVSMTNNQTLTFVPSANLSASTVYTVKVPAGGFTDANGNGVALSSTTFTTGTAAATPGLTVVSTNITNGSTNVSQTQPIIVTFSQILDPSTVNSATLKVMNTWNSNQGIAGTYAVSGDQVTFTPTNPYPAGVQITMGECGGPTDVLGDVFQNGSCYNDEFVYFTVSTATESPLTFQETSVSPANGATNVGRDQSVSVTFNHSVLSGSANGYNSQLYAGQDLQQYGSYSLSADNRTLTFNIGALNNNTDYTIAFPAGGISDMSGNTLASPFISTFSTVADPTTGNGSVSSTAPSGNATGIPTNSLLTLYLNRQADSATVPGSITVTVNGQVYAGAVAADASGYEIQYTPTTAFPAGATVQWFFSGASDVNGDAFTSDSGTFYTAATVNPATAEPTIVAVSPGYGSANVPTNTEIDIQYSQPIDASTLAGNVYRNGGPSTPYTVTPISSTLVRITPNTAWNASSTYYFCSNSSVKGTNGVAAQNSCYVTYFTTTAGTDTTSGTVTVGPPNGSVNVGTNAYIRLNFSKPADRTTVNSTNIQITTGGNPIPGSWTYNYNGADLMGANFYPLNPLPQSSQIKVAVTNILDYAGNTFSQPTVTFTTAAQPDSTAPSAALAFAAGATGIGTNATFTCRYSEPIDPSSVTTSGFYIYTYSNGVHVPVALSVSSDMLAVTITPNSPLAASSEYGYYCFNAIDLTGNSQSNADSYFYTGTGPVTTGPTLAQINPPNGSTNVPVNTNNGPFSLGSSLNMLFSEPVANNSLGSITLTPTNPSGSAIPISVTPEDGNFIVAVQLPYALQPNTTYTYNITGVTDFNGNAMTPVSTTFTTGSTYNFTQPTVTAVSPANNATAVPDNTNAITVTFSAPMDPALIDGNHIYLRTHNTQTLVPTTFTISADLKTVTLTPVTEPLGAVTIYDVVTNTPNWYLTDISGNAYTSTGVVSTFTTQ
ncbi:MAG: Ig-like domain-containing protein [Terracidiphilus sp.]